MGVCGGVVDGGRGVSGRAVHGSSKSFKRQKPVNICKINEILKVLHKRRKSDRREKIKKRYANEENLNEKLRLRVRSNSAKKIRKIRMREFKRV